LASHPWVCVTLSVPKTVVPVASWPHLQNGAFGDERPSMQSRRNRRRHRLGWYGLPPRRRGQRRPHLQICDTNGSGDPYHQGVANIGGPSLSCHSLHSALLKRSTDHRRREDASRPRTPAVDRSALWPATALLRNLTARIRSTRPGRSASVPRLQSVHDENRPTTKTASAAHDHAISPNHETHLIPAPG
jgi:hypothetical protein